MRTGAWHSERSQDRRARRDAVLEENLSQVWAGKQRPAILFHLARGMSRAGLIRIYGATAVSHALAAAPREPGR